MKNAFLRSRKERDPSLFFIASDASVHIPCENQ